MACSLPVKIDLESMRKLVECPICLEVPRDGVMLLCVNGHNICASCKSQLDTNNVNAKCPTGRCDFNNPPTVNRTVADFIIGLQCEFPCKYSASGCELKGTDDVLKRHENKCEYRSVPCPQDSCEEYVSANGLVEHYEKVHDYPAATRKDEDPDVIEEGFLWRPEDNSSKKSSGWSNSPYEVNAGLVFPCAYFEDGQIYIWLQMIAHSSVTEKFKCQITMSKDNYLINFTSPVYPIDLTQDMIMDDDNCLFLNVRLIRKMLTDNLTEDEKKDGCSSSFSVKFEIVKNTD